MQFSTRLGYGIGQLSEGVKQGAFHLFLFFFYNQVLGVPGSLAGLASFLALIVDAITDPMMGQISDRFQSRWGRRHPFMLAGALPFVFAMTALFSPPAGLNEAGLFAWMLGFAVLVRLLLTFFVVPHLSLGAEIVKGYHEKTALIGYRVFFSYLGLLITTVVGFVVFFPPSPEYPNGMLNAASYPGFGMFAGTLATVAMLWSVFATRSTIPHLSKPEKDPNAPNPLFAFITVFSALKYRAFRILFSTNLLFSVMSGVTQTLLIYVGTYLFGFEPKHLGMLAISPVIGVFLGPMIAKRLSMQLDKKRTLAITMVIGCIIAFSPQFLFLSGVLELMTVPQRFWLIFCTQGLSHGFFIAYVIMIDSMLSDTIDEHELETGKREEGMYFAARTFASKASFGIGALVAGIALDVIQFPEQAAPADVPMDTLIELSIFAGPISMALMLLTIVISRHYPLNRARHEEILSRISSAKEATG